MGDAMIEFRFLTGLARLESPTIHASRKLTPTRCSRAAGSGWSPTRAEVWSPVSSSCSRLMDTMIEEMTFGRWCDTSFTPRANGEMRRLMR